MGWFEDGKSKQETNNEQTMKLITAKLMVSAILLNCLPLFAIPVSDMTCQPVLPPGSGHCGGENGCGGCSKIIQIGGGGQCVKLIGGSCALGTVGSVVWFTTPYPCDGSPCSCNMGATPTGSPVITTITTDC